VTSSSQIYPRFRSRLKPARLDLNINLDPFESAVPLPRALPDSRYAKRDSTIVLTRSSRLSERFIIKYIKLLLKTR